MAKWGMTIDLDRCTACQACVTACQAENNLPPTGRLDAKRGRGFTWMEMIPFREGEFPKLVERLLPRPCLHCDNPPCVKVCPVGATFKNTEGIVGQIFSRCIGCRYCTTACPYTARYFNWHKPVWPEPMEAYLNPDVSVRPKGVVEKCTLCHHRLQNARDVARAEGRPLRPGEYTPACVEACPTGAMTFGDLSNPSSEVAQLAESRRAFKLLEDLGTEPKVIYLREGD
jgi:molybdopterin-containing oxidoreductase family iron-sulfur binding subunit